MRDAPFHPAGQRWVAGLLAGTLALAPAGPGLRACGPFLPEQILLARQAILRTPVADFAQEVAALTEADGAPPLPAGLSPAPPLRRDAHGEPVFAEPPDRLAMEKDEIREALVASGTSEAARAELLAAYGTFRAAHRPPAPAVSPEADAPPLRLDEVGEAARRAQESGASSSSSPLPGPLASGLPGEFRDYLEGAAAFWGGDFRAARAAWERLLARPAAERKHRGVWAAYMLARTLEPGSADSAEAAARYRRVRELRAEGGRDPLDLAVASLGWEARLALGRDDFGAAARLYYLQAVAGGEGNSFETGSSLRATVDAVLGREQLASPEALAAAARDPFLRRVITLYFACSERFTYQFTETAPDEAVSHDPEVRRRDRARLWLRTLEAAGLPGGPEAGRIAWAAYQGGDYAGAGAWVARAPGDDPLAEWLRAKLALRAGRNDEAAAHFARAVRGFPAEAREVGNAMDAAEGRATDGRAFRTSQFHADLGIVSLSRGDHAQALNALLRSGFWRDAAYVAERVMTPDELLAFVQRVYPQAPAFSEPTPPRPGEPGPVAEVRDENAPTRPDAAPRDPDPGNLDRVLEALGPGLAARSTENPAAFSLRWLLARRLARLGRGAQAREFYPAALVPKFDEFLAALKTSASPREPKPRRAAAFWRAARIQRWLGMELFGTEAEPDWRVEDGNFEMDSYRAARLEQRPVLPRVPGEPPPEPTPTPPPWVPRVGAQEKLRVAREEVRPEKRFHYRYRAADLAWQAAALLPDGSEETARVLAVGGLWLESVRETKAADRFYVAILRRCGKTALGQEANRLGHFPDVPHAGP